jgi:cobalamin biosynthesis Co2+ chelatase CbiK
MNLDRIRYSIRSRYQRLTRGYSDDDIVNLYYHISRSLIEPLKAFRANVVSHPYKMTQEQWERTLSKMIVVFLLIVQGSETKVAKRRITEGLNLFRKYFQQLWY